MGSCTAGRQRAGTGPQLCVMLLWSGDRPGHFPSPPLSLSLAQSSRPFLPQDLCTCYPISTSSSQGWLLLSSMSPLQRGLPCPVMQRQCHAELKSLCWNSILKLRAILLWKSYLTSSCVGFLVCKIEMLAAITTSADFCN